MVKETAPGMPASKTGGRSNSRQARYPQGLSSSDSWEDASSETDVFHQTAGPDLSKLSPDELEDELIFQASINNEAPLTFGLELEFAIGAANEPDLPKWTGHKPIRLTEDILADHQNLRYDIACLLRDNGVPAWAPTDNFGPPNPTREEEEERAVRETCAMMAADYAVEVEDVPDSWVKAFMFCVDKDGSVMESEYSYRGTIGEYDKWLDVEIKTPVLPFARETHNMVKMVCEIITSTYPCGINHETSVHCHVGRGSSGFTMLGLKKILSFLFTASRRIDQLHPLHQGPRNYWAPGIRIFSMLVNTDEQEYLEKHGKSPITCLSSTVGVPNPYHTSGYHKEINMLEDSEAFTGDPIDSTKVIARIWNAKNCRELLSMFRIVEDDVRHAPRGSYNTLGLWQIFHNIWTPDAVANGRKPTIEFRQGHGSLDGDHLAHWAKLCGGIVQFCIGSDMSDFIDVLDKLNRAWDPNEQSPERRRRGINDNGREPLGDYSVYDLLREIGLGEQADYYEGLGLYPLPPAPFAFEGTRFRRQKVGNQVRWVPIEPREEADPAEDDSEDDDSEDDSNETEGKKHSQDGDENFLECEMDDLLDMIQDVSVDSVSEVEEVGADERGREKAEEGEEEEGVADGDGDGDDAADAGALAQRRLLAHLNSMKQSLIEQGAQDEDDEDEDVEDASGLS